jgi:hypothetical protein
MPSDYYFIPSNPFEASPLHVFGYPTQGAYIRGQASQLTTSAHADAITHASSSSPRVITIPSAQGALGVPQPWARAAPEEPALGVPQPWARAAPEEPALGVPQPWARAAPEEPQPWAPGGVAGTAQAVQPEEVGPGRKRDRDITLHTDNAGLATN